MPKPKKPSFGRRGFLKGAAAGAAGLVAPAANAQEAAPQSPQNRGNATAPTPSAAALERDAGGREAPAPGQIIEHPGSDFMVDVLKSLNLEYLGSNPGSTFESLHESLINYGSNTMPEFLTCCHEESAVAMAHGYAKIEGRPMMALLHGTVGLQHAAMAIYNAYADRVPVYIVAGNHEDAAGRRPGVEWYHSAQDLALMVRDFVKWDDRPESLQHFADSAVRAYKIAMTPPMAPVLLVANHELQSKPNTTSGLRIPRMTPTAPPQGDSDAVAEAARYLVAAERPLIIAQRAARTPNGVKLLIDLAEALQAPVDSQERMNFPSHHPLAGTGGAGYQPDVTLCLEVNDVSTTARVARARGAKVISISSVDLFLKSNIQDFGRYADVDVDMGADAEATLPALIEACKRLITPDRRRAFEERGAKLAEAHKLVRAQGIEQASYGWNSSPISLARLSAELWPLIRHEDWSLVSWQGFISNWPNRLWKFDKHYQYIGGQGAGGMGYGAPAAVGAALANRKHGRLSISIQTDGDLNYAPGVLWTAAHHRIPLLTVMHNNRGYHMEVMFVEQQASLHNRAADRAHIGTKLWDPNIDYAKMAQAYGMHGEGPISNPDELAPALKRGIEIVKRGEPALIDVVTQPR
ncbi:MAG TPA: thiamine pyrophosphate-dependent enzyme [Bryobacteraceae bacterium]|jgi:thiamine pyrophosphate-dependent acetolactate synthase large subunit-like protein|nr:thiamine pyrophosphate-dependent enzyme [Bryobacteraceae bacterium]